MALSAEAEHLALALPFDRQVGSAGQTLTVWVRWLTTIQYRGDDIGR